ncbi:GL26278 [Drosophila persimilis]|uniref:Uncharacterized protein n=2 Tax=pseudoobscura subgroup TaxID=32358 RepID=A0A6I8UYD5_DROPS|nr:uncharacterized protein LOC6593801 [Drosophila persimilis]XP_002133359.2 uncharacterized protein LOC6902425 [Drosophila pseudoobscura]EDW37464.1 GL26278 [Drosophila persimilis]
MDYLGYVAKRTAFFHRELRSDFGDFIRAAASMAVGVVLGWIVGLLALGIYQLALFLGAKPNDLPEPSDENIDADLQEGLLTVDPRERRDDRWLEAYWEAQYQQRRVQLRQQAAARNQSAAST